MHSKTVVIGRITRHSALQPSLHTSALFPRIMYATMGSINSPVSYLCASPARFVADSSYAKLFFDTSRQALVNAAPPSHLLHCPCSACPAAATCSTIAQYHGPTQQNVRRPRKPRMVSEKESRALKHNVPVRMSRVQTEALQQMPTPPRRKRSLHQGQNVLPTMPREAGASETGLHLRGCTATALHIV